MIIAASASTLEQGAVIATRPANAPLSDIDTSGFPFLIHVNNMVATVAEAGANVVVRNIEPSCGTFSAAAPLKPYQPNHRMKQPRAPSVMECPGIAWAIVLPVFGSLVYLPTRAPSIAAPTKPEIPPTM